MFRTLAQRLGASLHHSVKQTHKAAAVGVRYKSSVPAKTKEQEMWDVEMIAGFQNPTIDGWEVRARVNEIAAGDGIPEPEVIIEGLKACRRVNDIVIAIRFLEMIRWKGGKRKDIWPYLMQEVGPTMKELGIPTLEEIGYDKPELACPNPDEH